MNDPKERDILDKTVAILRDSLSPDRIYLFGSRNRKRHPRGADFDIAVDHPQPQLRQARKILESIDECVGLHKVDVVYLPEVDDDFRAIILETGRLIYEKSA
jgi:predicted nucleotidyltransferase